MRYRHLIFAVLLLATQFALAGAGSDQPTNIVITNPYSNNVSWAQFCWSTNNQSDSMVMIGENITYSRQVYDAKLTTNHCVVVKNLEPRTQYYYSVASCTDPAGGIPCNKTDTHWSSAPFPTDNPTFTIPDSTSGDLAFNAFATGPSYIYQGSIGNVAVHTIQTSGTQSFDVMLVVTNATIDGQSCLPGTLLGANCGKTGIALTMLCDNSKELVNPATNNYPVGIWPQAPFTGSYFCWSSYFNEPGMQAKILPGQLVVSPIHNLSVTLQLWNYKTQSAVGPPQTVTYRFSVLSTAHFTVTAPTTFPPIPNAGGAANFVGEWGIAKCELLKMDNQQGLFLNSYLSGAASIYDPWGVFNYDGNRVYKELGDHFDGVTGKPWQPGFSYNIGDTIIAGGVVQVALVSGVSGGTAPVFNNDPGGLTKDGKVWWANIENKAYWNDCSQVIGTQYVNWAVNTPKWEANAEWNIFPWGMYMDYLRQGDVLNENCDGGATCSGLNAMADLRFGANILTYPQPGFIDEIFAYTYYEYQVGTIRALPYNVNVLLVNWLETGVPPANELKKRTDILIQTISEAIKYNPLDGPNNYACCYSAPNYTVGLWAMSLIHVYATQAYMNSYPDARIPIELLKLLDWFYSTQINQLGNDFTSPYQPWTVPYNCSIFQDNSCANNGGYALNNMLAPAYAWLGAVYGDSCKLPTSGMKCWDVADGLASSSWQAYTGSAKNMNQLLENYWNYVGWRTGAFPGTDSTVLPNHNPLTGPYHDTVGPYPAGKFPTKPTAGNVTSTTATITWYTFEKAESTVVKVGTDTNSINAETDCGPSTYTGSDNIWINTCDISNLTPGTLYYFGVGGTDAANNFAFSAFDTTVNLNGDYLNFSTTQ